MGEDKLTQTLSKASDSAGVTKAMEEALEAGARPGCPALTAGDKLLKAFQKAEKSQPDLQAKVEELKAELEKIKANPPKPKEKKKKKEEEEMTDVDKANPPKPKEKKKKKKEE